MNTRSNFNSLYIFWFSGLLWLFLCNYRWSTSFRPLYVAAQVLTFGSAFLFCRDSIKILFQSRYTLFMWLSLIVLFIYYYFDHGDSLLKDSLTVLMRGFVLFVLGYSISSNSRFRRIAIWLMLISFVIVALNDLSNIGITTTGFTRKSMARMATDAGLEQQLQSLGFAVNPMILLMVSHFPQLTFMVFLSCGLYDAPNGKIIKNMLLVLPLQFVLLISIIQSTWAASIMLFLIGICLMFIIRPVIRRENHLFKIVMTGLLLLILIFSYHHATSFQLGDSKGKGEQIQNIITGFMSLDFNKIKQNLTSSSGDRVQLAGNSIEGFFKAPFIGNGYYRYSAVGGGHSSIFDTLCYGGIIAGIPILAILLTWLYYAIFNYRYGSKNWMHVSVLIYVALYIIGSLFNPYFLRSYLLDIPFFFVGGLLCGDNAQIRATLGRRRYLGVKSVYLQR